MRHRGLSGWLLLRRRMPLPLLVRAPLALALALALGAAPVAARGGKSPAKDDEKVSPSATDTDGAREHLKKAMVDYDLGEFRRALVEFKEAYRLKNDPALLFNMGQCQRRMGHYQEAIDFYKTYLRKLPTGGSGAEAQRLIAECEQQLSKNEAAAPPAGEAPKTPAEAGASVVPPAPPVTPAGAVAPPPPEMAVAALPAGTAADVSHPPPAPSVAAPPEGSEAPVARLEAPAPVSPPPAVTLAARADAASAPPPTPKRRFYATWWFWTAVGVVAASGGAVGYLVSHPKAATPFCGNVGPCPITVK
jgi:hypothetical protein